MLKRENLLVGVGKVCSYFAVMAFLIRDITSSRQPMLAA
jgi:hypothetical protein